MLELQEKNFFFLNLSYLWKLIIVKVNFMHLRWSCFLFLSQKCLTRGLINPGDSKYVHEIELQRNVATLWPHSLVKSLKHFKWCSWHLDRKTGIWNAANVFYEKIGFTCLNRCKASSRFWHRHKLWQITLLILRHKLWFTSELLKRTDESLCFTPNSNIVVCTFIII